MTCHWAGVNGAGSGLCGQNTDRDASSNISPHGQYPDPSRAIRNLSEPSHTRTVMVLTLAAVARRFSRRCKDLAHVRATRPPYLNRPGGGEVSAGRAATTGS